MVCSQVSFMLHKYQHFNPNKYELDVKIAVVKSGFHCKYNINYHLVWVPKYRKIVLEGQVKDELRIILTNECKELELEMLALEIMPDHLHLFVGVKPTHVPCLLVKQLKGVSSIQLREQFPELAYLRYPGRWKQFPHLWARGYYCGSAGHVSQDAVKRYILEQEGKDVFEYSIYGDNTGQTKIGDFTK
jgi:putative transposase